MDHRVVNRNGRTPQRGLPEGITAMVRDVFKEQKSAETRGIRINVIRIELFPDIIDHKCQIHVALAQHQVFTGIIAMAGPVESHYAEIFVLGNELVGEFLAGLVIHVPAKAVSEDHGLFDIANIAAV
jgi:hypothetical protein